MYDDCERIICSAVQESELQLQLASERLHHNETRTQYLTLKSQYQKLQDELVSMRDDLDSERADRDRAVGRYKCLLDQLRREFNAKQTECEENGVKLSTFLNPTKIDSIKREIYQETEKAFQKKVDQLNREMDNYQYEFNRVSHELVLCETELDREKKENIRSTEDLSSRHEAEMVSLRKEKEILCRRLQNLESSSISADQLMRQMQTENDRLQQKIKVLTSEMAKERAVIDARQNSPDDVIWQQMKQKDEAERQRADESGTELHDRERKRLLHIQSLQQQRQPLMVTNDNLHGELGRQTQRNPSSAMIDKTTEFHQLKQEIEQLQQTVRDGNEELNELKNFLKEKDDYIAEKAKEHSRELQHCRDEEWKNLQSIRNEKMELEVKLQEMERRRIDEDEERKHLIISLKDQLNGAMEAKEKAEDEAAAERAKFSGQQQLLDKLQSDYSASLDARLQQMTRLNPPDYAVGRQELLEKIHSLTIEAQSASEQLTRCQITWGEEKNEMQKMIRQLNEELSRNKQKIKNNREFYNGKLKVWRILEVKLRKSLYSLRVEISKLKVEKELVRFQTHDRILYSDEDLRRQLNDLIEKHRRFSTILMSFDHDPTSIDQRGKLFSRKKCSPSNLSIEEFCW